MPAPLGDSPSRSPYLATGSGNPAGQRRRLLHPATDARLVELALVDVEVAYLRDLARAGRDRSQRRAAEEGDAYEAREDVQGKDCLLYTSPSPRD